MSDNNGVKQELREAVQQAGVRMLESGLTVATWGNISICDRETGLVYVTPSGMDYHKIIPEDINVYTLDGELVDGFRRPTIELHLHLGCLNARPEMAACVHTHPIFSTVFSSQGLDIPINVHDEAAQALGADVRCAPYELPGTQQLADAVVKTMGQDANAVMMRNHGLVSVGEDIDAAFKVAAVTEMVAEIYWRIKAMGGQYVPISDENVAAMQAFVKTKYGQY